MYYIGAHVAIVTKQCRFSRKVLWLEVSITNNESYVIAGYYLQAVHNYGRVWDYSKSQVVELCTHSS